MPRTAAHPRRHSNLDLHAILRELRRLSRDPPDSVIHDLTAGDADEWSDVEPAIPARTRVHIVDPPPPPTRNPSPAAQNSRSSENVPQRTAQRSDIPPDSQNQRFRVEADVYIPITSSPIAQQHQPQTAAGEGAATSEQPQTMVTPASPASQLPQETQAAPTPTTQPVAQTPFIPAEAPQTAFESQRRFPFQGSTTWPVQPEPAPAIPLDASPGLPAPYALNTRLRLEDSAIVPRFGSPWSWNFRALPSPPLPSAPFPLEWPRVGPTFFSHNIPSTPYSAPPFFQNLSPPFTPFPSSTPVIPPLAAFSDLAWPPANVDWRSAAQDTRAFRSPGTFPAQRLDSPVPIRVHPDLLYNPDNPAVPYTHWNLRLPLQQCRIFSRGIFREPILEQQAFAPSMRKVLIKSDHPLLAYWQILWGPIKIEEANGITVKHVMDAIFRYLHEPLTVFECNILLATPANWHALNETMWRRAIGGADLPMFVMNSPPKRIDVLGSCKNFQGLRVCMYTDGTWEAYTGLISGDIPRF